MRAFVEKNFGSMGAVERQTLVKITNRITLETCLFNPLRARRPQTLPSTSNQTLFQLIEQGRGPSDPFNQPFEDTSEDEFGRIEGEFCLTASNIAKADVQHGVLVFNEYNPLEFSRAHLVDYFMTARAWAEAAHEQDAEARYFFLLWNCLWKAGASVIHGHMQMTLGHDMHYGKIERLRRDALAYRERYNRSYFTDLVSLYRSLNLTADPAERVKALFSLTPTKENEVILLTDDFSPELAEAVYVVLAYYKSIGITSFNLGVQMPPIVPPSPNSPRDKDIKDKEDWSGFPVIVRLVDRGDPLARNSDIAAFEFFAANILTSDPLQLAEGFRTFLCQNRF
jgi:hypothetical protein